MKKKDNGKTTNLEKKLDEIIRKIDEIKIDSYENNKIYIQFTFYALAIALAGIAINSIVKFATDEVLLTYVLVSLIFAIVCLLFAINPGFFKK
ncbi:MAG: hypothetical protein R6V50_07170 [Thermoplasmatota archaeon]